ncbi:MAG: hypothetical protein ABIC57_03985, partial [bacterium]
KLKTIFFNEYPILRKDINKRTINIDFIGGDVLLVVGSFLLFSNGVWWFSILLCLICLVGSYDSFVSVIRLTNYMKHPDSTIYDKEGRRN